MLARVCLRAASSRLETRVCFAVQVAQLPLQRFCRFTFWANGETSNPGIQEIAELGSGEAFMEEVAACGAACGPGEGFMCEPMSGVCSAKGEVRMVAAYPYLSTATMVAPSPDWFTGFSSLPLCVDGQWVEVHEQDLQPYDAGTDSGASFLSEDEPTSPKEPIFRFSEVMPQEDNIFYNPARCAATASFLLPLQAAHPANSTTLQILRTDKAVALG